MSVVETLNSNRCFVSMYASALSDYRPMEVFPDNKEVLLALQTSFKHVQHPAQHSTSTCTSTSTGTSSSSITSRTTTSSSVQVSCITEVLADALGAPQRKI